MDGEEQKQAAYKYAPLVGVRCYICLGITDQNGYCGCSTSLSLVKVSVSNEQEPSNEQERRIKSSTIK